MSPTATLDIRDLVTGTGPFGPGEIRQLLEGLGADPAIHRDLRIAVQELEAAGDRSPAASVKVGVCQQLLGRSRALSPQRWRRPGRSGAEPTAPSRRSAGPRPPNAWPNSAA